jgi:hypothetical protein
MVLLFDGTEQIGNTSGILKVHEFYCSVVLVALDPLTWTPLVVG